MELPEQHGFERVYYVLKIFIDPSVVGQQIYSKYLKQITEHQNMFNHGEYENIDAGFDLYTPEAQVIGSQQWGQKVPMNINCSMSYYNTSRGDGARGVNVAYYLYPRSSTGAKTPLRLSNSVGIIDAGYRGNITALFDNWSNESFTIKKADRVVQICAPNMTYPIYPMMVSSVEELGLTKRGNGGFGSTGA